MSLKNIQLAAINPIDRVKNLFEVIVHSEDGNQMAMFDCSSESDAIKLRNAIREHADKLRRVADFRPKRTGRGAS